MLTNTLLLYMTQEALAKARTRLAARHDEDDTPRQSAGQVPFARMGRRSATYWRPDKVERHRQAALRN